jgi:hypothetical protein
VWGNVVNTHVQPIITDVVPGDQNVRLMRVNRVTVTKIDGGGLAQYSGIAGDCNGDSSPFGGDIYIEGDFTVKSDSYFNPATGEILPGAHPPAYQVFVHLVGSPAAATQLTNSFDIAVFPINPPSPNSAVTITQTIRSIGGGQYYFYQEGVIQAVNPRTLGKWEASGLAEGDYDIEVKGFVWSAGAYVPMATPSQTQRVYVFNGSPQVTLSIDPPLDSSKGNCGNFTAGGAPITGKYSVSGEFLGGFSLTVIGSTPVNSITLDPSKNSWSLETEGMDPCGYVINLSATDRALVSGSCSGHSSSIAVGFCLREP